MQKQNGYVSHLQANVVSQRGYGDEQANIEKAQNTKKYSRGIVVIRKRQAVIPWYHPQINSKKRLTLRFIVYFPAL
jgi:hypothetical protein